MQNHHHYEQEALATYLLADEIWNAELQHQYGAEAQTMRYSALGKGVIDTTLRRIYNHRSRCFQHWQAAKQSNSQSHCGAAVQS